MVNVTFTYDEEAGKWDVIVSGVTDGTEARQAFNAVVLTCRDVVVGMDHVTIPLVIENAVIERSYTIEPAVTLAGLFQSGSKPE